MKKCICALLTAFVAGVACGAETTKSMPQVAFEVLKTGDMKVADTILPSEQDVYAFVTRNKEKVEKRIGKTLTEEDMKKGAEKERAKTVRKVKRQVETIRKTIENKGIDISKAELVSVLDKSGKPYTEDQKEAKVDVYLHFRVGDKSFVVLLDDCIFGVSDRKLGDGYRLQE